MITQEQAEAIADRIIGQREDMTWELIEFDAGWLIQVTFTDGVYQRGASVRVIERESGRVMEFPSSVSSERILKEYAQVLNRGRPEDSADAT